VNLTVNYPIDLSLPYTILDHDPVNDTYTVSGTAKIIHSTKWLEDKTVEFGGHQSIFIIKKNQFLTRSQKKQLRWVKKHLGDKQHERLQNDLYDIAIASHIYNTT
jgi:hypothetical protein